MGVRDWLGLPPQNVVSFRPAATRGTWVIASQAEAIALEQSFRAHVFSDGRRPDLTTPRLRALEQAAREAERREDWAACQAAWEHWLGQVRLQEDLTRPLLQCD